MVKLIALLFLLAAQTSLACRIALVQGAFVEGSVGSRLFLSPEDYYAEYVSFYKSKGCETWTAQLPPDVSLELSALALRDQLERRARQGGSFHIVAHSQGAVITRLALKRLKMTGAKTLVSIGSPHHGTPLADWVDDHRKRGSWLYWGLKVFANYDLRLLSFVTELSPAFLQRHAESFAEVPGVRYGSAQADCRSDCHFLLRILSRWVGIADGDGLVPVESQKWGEDLGRYDLDHISEVGSDEAKRAERQRLLAAFWEFQNRVK